MKRKGFTLVELLVVIAIIGILATIVLVNLNAARNKAKDAAIKATLSEARVAAELYYDSYSSSYLNFCIGTDALRIKAAVESQNPPAGAWKCYDAAGAWCAEYNLTGTSKFWCVDFEGASAEVAATKCDSTARDCK